MMRIAVDCRMVGSGGIGSFISELVPCFLEENECLLIGTHAQCADFVRLPNARFCFCDVRPFSLRELLAFPGDILDEINHCDAYFTPYCNVPGGIEIPIFTTIHDVVFLDVRGLAGFLGRLARKMLYQRAVNYSDAVFTVSEFSKERILHHLRCKRQVVVVHNSAPRYLSEPFADGAPPKKDQILFVGNIKRHKGLKNLLEAYEAASERSADFRPRLVIVGNAENFRTGDEETVRKIREMQESGKGIEFTGRISNDRLRRLYAESRLLVQPSLYEGFGIPPLEAMTVGTRALISDIPVFREIYGHLPVAFFRAGDSDDLAEKLLRSDDSPLSDEETERVRRAYSYKDSADRIISTLAAFRGTRPGALK